MLGSISDPASPDYPRGIFPSQALEEMVAHDAISADPSIDISSIQPASLDLRLGEFAWRVPASFLPGPGTTVEDRVRDFEMHRLDLSDGTVLERGCVYIIPLLERLNLPQHVSAFANPKSSTGRLDVFTRVISDRNRHFDLIDRGYSGPLYAEVSPRTFSISVRTGARLTQLRLRNGMSTVGATDLPDLHHEAPLLDRDLDPAETELHGGLGLHIDLSGNQPDRQIGWRARHHAGVIDLDQDDRYDPADYWEPLFARGNGLILNPGDFYILATCEAIAVPPDYAAEMVPYDTLVGEFRVHYAGFFDPGFGWSPNRSTVASRGVLEVRSHDVPFLLEHRQLVAHLRYERMAKRPKRIYGDGIGSHYQGQGLKLSRQFRKPS